MGVVCLGCFCVCLVVWVLFLSCASIPGRFSKQSLQFPVVDRPCLVLVRHCGKKTCLLGFLRQGSGRCIRASCPPPCTTLSFRQSTRILQVPNERTSYLGAVLNDTVLFMPVVACVGTIELSSAGGQQTKLLVSMCMD